MKVKPKVIKSIDRAYYLDMVITALASVKSKAEIKRLLNELLTESEMIMIGRRIVIAKKLLEGKSYEEIIDEMRVGADTIMKVHKFIGINDGGYEKVVNEIAKVFRYQRKHNSVHYENNPMARLKRKYPLHFLLFNLFDK